MNALSPLPLTALTALAPEELPSLRASRYLGDNISTLVSRFSTEDQDRVRRMYDVLQQLLVLVRANMDDREVSVRELRAFSQQVGWSRLVRDIQQLGETTTRTPDDDVIGKVFHDIRGGGFQALSIQIQFIELGIVQSDDIHRLFFLTRDHLKIMRNALVDIDPEGYERDRHDNLHNVDLLTEKWQKVLHKVHGHEATVIVDCRFQGNVSERCLEFSALDRVLYNLMNNAVRYATDSTVYLAILPFPELTPHNLRFVIYNALDTGQRGVLQERYGDQLGALFHGGFTTGGTGLGMRICADFVTNAYGVRTVDEGLNGGYFGAAIQHGYFVNWFHWPIAGD